MMDVNVTGVFLLTQAFGMQMVRQRSGSIIHNVAGRLGSATTSDRRPRMTDSKVKDKADIDRRSRGLHPGARCHHRPEFMSPTQP